MGLDCEYCVVIESLGAWYETSGFYAGFSTAEVLEISLYIPIDVSFSLALVWEKKEGHS